MPSDKAAYLAAHYLTADSKPSSSSTKKRKRKQPPSSSGLLITDDDETGWGASSAPKNDAENDDAPLTIAGTTTDFRRTKKSGWKPLGGGAPPSTKDDAASSAAAAADAIIASAAAESAAAAAAEAAEDLQPDDTPQMSNGTLAGLQSAASLTAQLRRRQQLEAAELAELQAARANPTSNPEGGEEEIILRDATGRRVDASLRRAEARRQAAEAERAAKAKVDLLRGEVQTAQAQARRSQLEDAALMPLARNKDDVEMNEELKQAERWNDPMAEFLASSAPRGKGGKKTAGRRPVYKGGAPPNRYGIRPGYRWDGVDRGNGFEAERFKALNRRERDKGLEYAWQMDE
ncbi:putative pre-mRNA splicing protein [Parachaetomium inaequale]|uniref:Pre-mRNA splicing protein n=1 Tax=Parachaetomium inaequale TaxID=2588326 RepID=A0AAN6PQZ1_9PEZI|nr:putative pre-mRNA splicing protein [Parachaetomium inaequale]